mmetsp:Transcript_9516/g.19779  ORF Transcript_9516/g.19779 Transcript_9516/m.19779 type:complete len:90 (+) Transcript_9516:205-474(+)
MSLKTLKTVSPRVLFCMVRVINNLRSRATEGLELTLAFLALVESAVTVGRATDSSAMAIGDDSPPVEGVGDDSGFTLFREMRFMITQLR